MNHQTTTPIDQSIIGWRYHIQEMNVLREKFRLWCELRFPGEYIGQGNAPNKGAALAHDQRWKCWLANYRQLQLN